MISRTDRYGVLAILFVAAAPWPARAQALTNVDFETPGSEGSQPAGWTIEKGKFFQDPVKKHSGTFAGKLDGGDGFAAAYQDVPISPGTAYRLTGYWRNGDRTAEFDQVVAEVHWLTAPGGSSLGQAAVGDSARVVSEWTPFQLNTGMPLSGAGGARIVLKSEFGIGAFDSLGWGPAALSLAGAAGPPSGGGRSASVAVPTIPPLSQVLAATPGAVAPPPPGRPATPSAASSAQLPDLSRMTYSTQATLPTLVSSAGAPPGGGPLSWAEDLRSARRTASAEKRRILVFFTLDDAVSRQTEMTLFSSREVRAVMGGYVPVKLDLDKNRNLALALQVTRPGTVALYDGEGEFLARIDDPTAEKLSEKLKSPANP